MTLLKILRGVPLDSSYQNAIAPHKDYTAEEETALDYRQAVIKYLLSKTVFTSYDGSNENAKGINYIRETENTLKVALKRDDLEGCNYLMFTNDLQSYSDMDDCFWHFAFIDAIDYISESASRVHFTLDVLNTWLPQLSAGQGFVIREHVSNDTVGNNVQPEPFTIQRNEIPEHELNVTLNVLKEKKKANGTIQDSSYEQLKYNTLKIPLFTIEKTAEQMMNSYTFSYESASDKLYFDFTDAYVALVSYSPAQKWGLYENVISGRNNSTYEWTISPATADKYAANFNNGVSPYKTIALRYNPYYARHSGVLYKNKNQVKQTFYPVDDRKFLSSLAHKITADMKGEIISVNIVPYSWLSRFLPTNFLSVGWSYIENAISYKINFTVTLNSISSYKNAKILTYPFTKVILANATNEVELKPEYFSLSATAITCDFNVIFSFAPQPELSIAPSNYRQNFHKQYVNTDSLSPSAIVSVSALDQYMQRDSIKGLTSLFSSTMGMLMGGFASAAGAFSTLSHVSDIATAATSAKVPITTGSSFSMLAAGILGIYIYIESASANDKERLDKFFNRYGYAINANKIPQVFLSNRVTRSAYNYIKVNDITLLPKKTHTETMFTTSLRYFKTHKNYMPSNKEVEEIKRILSQGVTFWEVPDKLGDYSQINYTPTKEIT